MLALKIIGIIALIIFAICMITVGVDINYVDMKLTLSLKVCGILIQVFPKKKKPESDKPKKEKPVKEVKPKKEKPEKKKKPKKEKAKKKKPGLMFSAEEILALIKKVLKGISRFNHGFNVNRFLLDWTATGKDPYNVARNFAYVNAAISSLQPLCAKRFRCRDLSVRTAVDFGSDEFLVLDFGIAIVLRIGAIFRMVNTILFGALGILIKNKVRWLWMKIFHRDCYNEEMEIATERSEKIAALLAKLKSKKAEEIGDNNDESQPEAVSA